MSGYRKIAKKTYIFYNDPGHGWLRVHHDEIEPIKDKISSFSYVTSRFVYLEEDCDAQIFLDLLKQKNIEYVIKERYSNNSPSRIRSYGQYNSKNINRKFKIGDEITLKYDNSSPAKIIDDIKNFYIILHKNNKYRLSKIMFYRYIK